MSNPLDIFTPEELDRLQQRYKTDGNQAGFDRCTRALERAADRAPVHTQELAECGRLYRHDVKMPDNTGRTSTQYSGDIAAFLEPFVSTGYSVRTNWSGIKAERKAAQTNHALERGIAAIAAEQG